jgi:uncharacterized membrane protein (DUF4010 family)
LEVNTLKVAQKLAIATALGLLVGLERLRAGKEAGIRTFSLSAMAGCLSQAAGYPFLGVVALLLTGVIIVVTNMYAFTRGNGPELTTSVALVVTSFAGILVGQGQVFAPVASVILVLVLLAWKDEMVGFSQGLSREEVHAAITLLLLGFVVLPVLPTGTIDPWHLIDLRKVWITVVLVSGIGFVNYVLLRLYGARGITYTGFLGGLVNSTATVAEMANHIKEGGEPFAGYAFRGIMLAKTAMVIRNGVILGILAPAALPAGLLPSGLMLAVTVTLAIREVRNGGVAPPVVNVQSPFSMRSALQFGFYFLMLTLVGGVAQRLLGDLGFYAVSFFGGMVSSSSTAATAGTLAHQSAVSPTVASLGVVLSCISSALVLIPLVVRAAKGTTLARRMVLATVAMILAAGLGLYLNTWLLPILSV